MGVVRFSPLLQNISGYNYLQEIVKTFLVMQFMPGQKTNIFEEWPL